MIIVHLFKDEQVLVFNLSWPWLPELSQGLGGGQICLTIKKFQNQVENHFFKACHCLHYIKIIIVEVGLAKENLLQKKLRQENPRGGGQICPPPRPNRVKGFKEAKNEYACPR